MLVVDDDPAFRAVLRDMLTGAEHVTEARDGAEALRALHADPPHLVLLDLDIPPPDGAAVLKEMRRTPALAGVPVVLVTAADLTTEQRRTLGATAALLEKAHLSPDVLPVAAELAARLAGGAG